MPIPRTDARHYPALDGLRGFAALLIVWHHFLQLVPAHGRVLSVITACFGNAWAGVDLFFVLSGFLITGILADTKTSRHYFRTFYGRRVLRIFPLYYAVLLIVLVVLPQLGATTRVSSDSDFFFWTYTSNFYFATHEWHANYLTHLWTLAIEEQFYLVWPLVIFFVSDTEKLRRSLPWLFLAVLITRILLLCLGFNSIWLNLVTFTHCDGLLLGSYLALAVRSEAPTALRGLRPNPAVAIPFALAAFLISDLSGLLPSWEAIPAIALTRAAITLSLLAIAFVWLVRAATEREVGWVFDFFSRPMMRWFGKYSYALYILHVPLGFLILQSFDLSRLSPGEMVSAEAGLFLLYVGACTLSAYLSWHLFEKHFLKLKRYFSYSSRMGNTV